MRLMSSCGCGRSPRKAGWALMAGIYAGTDVARGVHKAPVNELIRSIRGFELAISRREQDCEQDILNPQNINVVRAFPGCGNRV